jgi:hypothetical protein
LKLEDIQELWHKDSEINYTELGTESISIPRIHDKYLKIFTDERIRLKGFEFELSKMAGNNIWEDFSRTKYLTILNQMMM